MDKIRDSSPYRSKLHQNTASAKPIYLSGVLISFMPGSFGRFLTRRTKESPAVEQQADDGRTRCAFFR